MPALKPRLVIAFTHPKSAVLLRGQLADAARRGYDVTLLTSPGSDAFVRDEGAGYAPVAMEREIAPLKDLRALPALRRTLRRLRPHIVNAGTPKAGLLVTLAATLARVPCRIYTLHGLRLETTTGKRRALLLGIERLTCRLAHRVVCVSPSLRDRAVELSIVSPQKAVVLGKGSNNGFDTGFWQLTDEFRARGEEIRRELGLNAGDVLLGYIGRIVRDKGIAELLAAWRTVHAQHPQFHLLVVGDFEAADAVSDEDARTLREADVHLLEERVGDVRPYLAALDFMALPSYREGFGNILAEASALERAVVATDIPGCRDAVADEVSGILVPPRDAAALAGAFTRYVEDASLRVLHGQQGRARIVAEFRNEVIWDGLDALYRELLRERGLPVPAAFLADAASAHKHDPEI